MRYEKYRFICRLENKASLPFYKGSTFRGAFGLALAAYEFFKDYSSKMIYIPIPKNEFIVPVPKKRPGKPVKPNLRLSVIEYLTACGLLH